MLTALANYQYCVGFKKSDRTNLYLVNSCQLGAPPVDTCMAGCERSIPVLACRPRYWIK